MLDEKAVIPTRAILLPMVCTLALLLTVDGASAQPETPPVPQPEEPEPSAPLKKAKTKKKRKGSTATPGFPEEDEEEEEELPEDEEEEEEVDDDPISVPAQNKHDRLVEQILATSGEVGLAELIDEVLADVVAELGARPAKWFSPMAIRQVIVSPNVKATFQQKLRGTIISHLHGGTEIIVVKCIECDAARTQIVDGKWIVTKGLVSTAELRRVAKRVGIKTFMDVSFTVEPEVGVVEIGFTIIRARDSRVMWADSFRADESTPMLLRSSEAPQKRMSRLRDLEMLLEGRPFYGYAASGGFMLIPYDDPTDGDIGGATAGYRIYERFGEDRRIIFGLDLMGFINTSRLAGGLLSAGMWWIPIRPDLVNPELRIGGKGGAFVAGSQGNAAIFQLGAEVLLRYRFGLYGYVLFMTKSLYNNAGGEYLGGLGMATGISFNW